MTTGDRVFWVHSERGSPQNMRHTICQGRLIAVGNSGTAAVVVGDLAIWFVEASKLVLSLADAQYCLRVLEVPAPAAVEPELCCVHPGQGDFLGVAVEDSTGPDAEGLHTVRVQLPAAVPVPEMEAGAWCRPISGCEHSRKKTTNDGWECLDCGLVEHYS